MPPEERLATTSLRQHARQENTATETNKSTGKSCNCLLTFIVPYEANKMAFHFQVVLIKVLVLLTKHHQLEVLASLISKLAVGELMKKEKV